MKIENLDLLIKIYNFYVLLVGLENLPEPLCTET